MSESLPEDYQEDTILWPLITSLHQCLCDTLTERSLNPGNCFCGILPGETTVWDQKDGMAWVRLTSVVPSTVFPAQDFDLRNCGKNLAAEIEVGVLHCAPRIGADKVPPTEMEQFESARLQFATMMAMRAAILCCQDLGSADMVLGAYNPLGPNGGLVGGAWTVNVGRA